MVNDSRLGTIAGYLAMLVATIGIFLLIAWLGAESVPGLATQVAPRVSSGGNAFLRVLVALTAIIITGQILAKLLARLHQPPVIGEVVAGILLGPSLIGPELSAFVLPPAVAPFLAVVAQLGVVLYMFLVGLQLDPRSLEHGVHSTIAISHASIFVPLLLGAALALPLYPRLGIAGVGFTQFALFMGVAMSVTAFPVLARILTDYDLARTRIGTIALSCAAVDDVTAWCLLAFVVGVSKADASNWLFVAGGALAFIAFMVFVARPGLAFVTRRFGEERHLRPLTTCLFVALLASALCAESIGIHAIFGAFLLGAVVPHDSRAATALTGQLEHVVVVLLLPAFFAFTGMRTRIDLLAGIEDWAICAAIVLVATIGKFGGTLAAARFTGLGWREGSILGALMNTRGLMELIVLNVGLDLGVISPRLFAMMVLMALVTTAATAPILKLLRADRAAEEAAAAVA